ncbi:hypothetical protein [Desulfosediminicola sp.]|uniref:hypothetical protein n=1 Tax=Desulfosediminicola sp. TaxID=2886825 RepID=UPI003AF2B40E
MKKKKTIILISSFSLVVIVLLSVTLLELNARHKKYCEKVLSDYAIIEKSDIYEAIEILEKYTNSRNEDRLLIELLAKASYVNNELDKSEYLYKKAVVEDYLCQEYKPDEKLINIANAQVHLMLSAIYKRKGDVDKQIIQTEKAMKQIEKLGENINSQQIFEHLKTITFQNLDKFP